MAVNNHVRGSEVYQMCVPVYVHALVSCPGDIRARLWRILEHRSLNKQCMSSLNFSSTHEDQEFLYCMVLWGN